MDGLPGKLGEVRDLLGALGRPPHDPRAASGRPETILVTLIEEIRARDLDADAAFVEGAERRGRLQGIFAGLAGPATEGLVDALQIVDETLVACTVARRWAPAREPVELAADLLVLWGLMPGDDAARAALAGTGEGVFDRWQERHLPHPPERFTPRATLAWLWRCRGVLAGARDLVGGGRGIPLVGVVRGARRERRERAEWREWVERRYRPAGAAAQPGGATLGP